MQKELEPYLAFASSLEKVLAWKSDKSRRWFLVALIAAYFAEYVWELIHLSIILLLVRNLQRKRFREHIRTEAKQVRRPILRSINSLQKQTSIKAGHWT